MVRRIQVNCKCCGIIRSVRTDRRISDFCQPCVSLWNRFKDYSGTRFGKTLILGFSHMDKGAVFLCLCDCGQYHSAKSEHLVAGDIISCGCARDIASRKNIQLAWQKMRTMSTCKSGHDRIYFGFHPKNDFSPTRCRACDQKKEWTPTRTLSRVKRQLELLRSEMD